MRLLAHHELNLVAGGYSSSDFGYYDYGEIVVTGHSWSYEWIDYSYSYSWTEMGGGGGEPEPAPEQNDCKDHRALEIKAAINADSNHDTKEHGSVIYRGSDGAVHASPIFEGDERHIDPAVVRQWLSANNIPISDVVGFAHNHDAWYYGTSPEEADINRYPSTGDWAFADSLVNDGAGGAGGAGFSLYVIDTYGHLREFDYADRTAFGHLSNPQKANGTALPDETVNDGSTC
jgi:hypothetical protein